MKKKFFGTDGIRGLVNAGHMRSDTLVRIAQAAGSVFQKEPRRHLVVIGKDTRLSGYLVEPALTSGFISVGMDVVLVGPLPTPAVAFLTRSLRADLGVMISASHNPYTDNGIKLFTPEGHKLSDAQELEIEQAIDCFSNKFLAEADHLGRAKRLDDAPGRYIEFVKSTFPVGLRLDGLKIVIDCAHGAAYKIAPSVLWELGADVIAVGVSPNGENINLECGSTDPKLLQQTVVEERADIGIALDGDADRIVICDEQGSLVEGDQLLGVIAHAWKKNGLLKGNTVVSTIMSNGGLKKFLMKNGIDFVQSQVGDRYVTESMKKSGANVGGEPSGHIIFSDYGTTGDGLMAALQILSVLVQEQKPASHLFHPFSLIPQRVCSLRLEHTYANAIDAVRTIIEQASTKGIKVVVRPSGTEPVVRIMVEGEDTSELNTILECLIQKIKKNDS